MAAAALKINSITNAPISAMFVIFRDVESTQFNDPSEAVMGMFIMSLGEFAEMYEIFL